MNEIQLYIKSIINNKLERNLLKVNYDYYKNKIINNLPKALNSILELWKNIYDDLYKNITDNKLLFKYSINELFITVSPYLEIYKKNISYDFINSVVYKLKNEFNYTNKYYYNAIYLKINDLCKEILNTLPKNEKPFDEVINVRYMQIKNSFNSILNYLKNEYLIKNIQEKKLNITSNYFFPIEDIINEHLSIFNSQMNVKMNNIRLIIDEISNKYNKTNESIVAKFYLENNINKELINNIYDKINDIDFIDLEKEAYQKMTDDVLKNNNNVLFRNINKSIKELNDNNLKDFNEELKQYKIILKDKLNNNFYSKKNLEEKIDSLFSNGLNKINPESKQLISNEIDLILKKIKDHISNEGKRLSNDKPSYSNNINDIKNRLNNYKITIYQNLYSAITLEVDNYKTKIIEKFYKNHIISDLNKFKNYFDKSNFGIAEFLNMSINSNENILKEINSIINEYKNITLDRIDYLYNENIHSLDEILSFSNIKLKINNEIDSFYNLELFSILTKNNNNNNNQRASNYDFSSSIINDINKTIKDGIKKIKEEMKHLEGNNYEINDIIETNFGNMEDDVINKIKNKFEYFSENQINKEVKEFDKNLEIIVSDNCNNVLNDVISFYSFDFFERILELNDIEKINQLYKNLEYSLYQSINYYLNITNTNYKLNFPQNIKNEILSLNDIEKTIELKSNKIILLLNSTLKIFIKNQSSYIAQKYANNIIYDSSFTSKFGNKVYEIINIRLNQNINRMEAIYNEQIRKNIIDDFIIKYINILKSENEDINNNIQYYKNELFNKLKISFSFDTNSFLVKINNSFNKTNLAIEKYLSYFSEFKISDDIKKFFYENIIEEEIIPIYNQFNSLIIELNAKYIINNIDFNSNKYKNIYSIQILEEKINRTNSKFYSNLDNYTNILIKYGSNEEIYEQNLLKKIYDYENGINIIEEKSYDINYEMSFNELKNISFILEQFVLNLSLFSELENKINNLNEKENEYKYSKYILNLYKSDINNYFIMADKLNELIDITSRFYSQINFVYLRMKDQIINNISRINQLIKICENTTNEVINKNYIKYRNNLYTVAEYGNLTNKNQIIPGYSYYDSNNIFRFETEKIIYLMNYDYKFDIDNSTLVQNITGNLKNYILPTAFNIDFVTSDSPLGKIWKKLDVNFNCINIFINFILDCKLNNVTITTNFQIENFSVITRYYRERINTYKRMISGINFLFQSYKSIIDIETPQNEKCNQIPSKNKTIIETYRF